MSGKVVHIQKRLSSLKLSNDFEICHHCILEVINEGISDYSCDFVKDNFEFRGKDKPVMMTPSGYMSVAMMLPGGPAEAYRVSIIERYNNMADELKLRGMPVDDPAKKLFDLMFSDDPTQ